MQGRKMKVQMVVMLHGLATRCTAQGGSRDGCQQHDAHRVSTVVDGRRAYPSGDKVGRGRGRVS